MLIEKVNFELIPMTNRHVFYDRSEIGDES
jgi:hypothetical protein